MMRECIRPKLGFGSNKGNFSSAEDEKDILSLWNNLETVLEKNEVDYTFFFRGLAEVDAAAVAAAAEGGDAETHLFDESKNVLLAWAMTSAKTGDAERKGISQMSGPARRSMCLWIEKWANLQVKSACNPLSAEDRKRQMRGANPLLVPRNWAMTEAYEAAGEENQDMSIVKELLEIYSDSSKLYVVDKSVNTAADIAAVGKGMEKWVKKSPCWANRKAGVKVMS